ncbi:MAG: sigma 54-interacting transcriptional regulator [Pyrinomonadaceae bacterium]|nr:sigma 54-interacting transcriptional regulator [Pyrinomonadaceae bacterium]
MNGAIPFNSINELIVRKSPMRGTLKAIVSQVLKQEKFALVRIWLIDKGDICETCVMRAECPNQESCLHLTASEGKDLSGEKVWAEIEGKFKRFPIGVRKIGVVGESGKSVYLDNLQTTKDAWIVREDWIKSEKIEGFAAHPLKFQDDILGVIAVFSRQNISTESFEWLRVFADQASIAIANARAFEEIEKLRQKLEEENDYLKEEIKETAPHKFLIGKSPVWTKILQQIELVASSEATVLLTGESGTGKEMVARAVHEAGSRKNAPLVKVNCAAISNELFESEFFGHIKGAFTGAFKDRIGRFQLADSGTIFLDEVGELPLQMQGKLLRILQEKQFERVGEDRTRTVDVRVIAATNRDLWAEVEKGNFRQDLFYRLSVFPIHLPPLRERLEDIEPLTQHFLKQFAEKMRCEVFKLTADDIKTLQNYSYPGNVRELQNIVERAIILAQCNRLNFTMPQVLNRMIVTGNEDIPTKKSILTYTELKDLERENIIQALKKSGYKIYGKEGAAEILDSKPTTLISRIKALQIPMRP